MLLQQRRNQNTCICMQQSLMRIASQAADRERGPARRVWQTVLVNVLSLNLAIFRSCQTASRRSCTNT